MKQLKSLFAILLTGVVFLSSCVETNKDIKYNKYTKTDTEAFNFLKKTYEEALFQQYAAQNYNLGAQSQKISQTYKDLTDELVKLATENNVLMPNFSKDHFAETTVLPASAQINTDTTFVDSTAANPLISEAKDTPKSTIAKAPKPVGSETPAQKVIHSQEKIVHQFEVASLNTNLKIRHFAESKLAGLEELLEQSKSTIK